MQLFHSEYPPIWGKFCFLFYQCGVLNDGFASAYPPASLSPGRPWPRISWPCSPGVRYLHPRCPTGSPRSSEATCDANTDHPPKKSERVSATIIFASGFFQQKALIQSENFRVIEFLLLSPLLPSITIRMVVTTEKAECSAFSPVVGIGTPPTPHPQTSVRPPPPGSWEKGTL